MTKNLLPNFLGLGAAKAATVSARRYLQQHPDVFVAAGEPRFFSFEGQDLDPEHVVHQATITDRESYHRLFDEHAGEKAIGEVSPSYLFNPRAPENIKKHIPDAKMFAILRDPSERAYSHFVHMAQNDFEVTTDFAEALREPVVQVGKWKRDRMYLPFGFYHEQLSRYFELFPPEQIKIFLYEEVIRDNKAMMRELYRFVGVDDTFEPDTSLRYNPSGIPKSRFIEQFTSKPHPVKTFVRAFLPGPARRALHRTKMKIQRKNLEKGKLSPEMRQHLIGIYREDILKLQDLIGRDLSTWLK